MKKNGIQLKLYFSPDNERMERKELKTAQPAYHTEVYIQPILFLYALSTTSHGQPDKWSVLSQFWDLQTLSSGKELQ